MNSALEKKSKYLSKILRHDPASAGVTLDEKGWAKTNQIMTVLGVNREELNTIVAENNKKRFEFSNDNRQIRARQGHSIQVDTDLEDVTVKDKDTLLYHGTKEALVPIIMKEGLKKMSRLHVHLTADYTVAKKRAGSGVVLTVVAGGLKLLKSANDVYLMDEVPPENIKHIPNFEKYHKP